ncbi:hypothetical protein SO802_013048 [Lithocarpus litseifolius]|uniref:Uncharacterized protein n=1 Tax=Lithocarpus litseifolius TaxID=425828 RepID=A0AAW2D543_9ROSI
MILIYLGLDVQQEQRSLTLLIGRLFRREHNGSCGRLENLGLDLEMCIRKQLKQKESSKLYSAVLEERRVKVPSRHLPRENLRIFTSMLAS